ncbi:MAG: hypothetical protein ACR5K4_03960 [Sodalis sp. (in: enterobacteria)]
MTQYFTNKDGVSGLVIVKTYDIITTIAVLALFILHLTINKNAIKYLADKRIFRIVTRTIAASVFNHFEHIKLSEYLGFFADKPFLCRSL